MTQSTFSNPTQFEITEITIDGQDITGIFFALSIYEDIYRPCVTGSVTIADSDGAKFIEEQRIEFIEPIEFSFKSAAGEVLQFKGVLNSLKNEYVDGSMKFYVIDFTSESVRKNEETFIVKSYKNSLPQDIVREMVDKVGGQLETQASGKQMNYIGSRRRPMDVIKYVLTHGLSQKTEATENEETKDEEAKGTTGFLCWETLDGFRFETIDDVVSGEVGTERKDFQTRLVNRSLDMDTAMKSIVQAEFKQIGDFQTKLRSGAFGATNISFDMDTGQYKEYKYYNDANMTEKQKKILPEGSVTRFFMKPIDNQKFDNTCEKAQPLTGDQSRGYLNQNAGRQNTFSDQTGHFTLYPQFTFRAGDPFECKIAKVKDEKSEGGYDKKHSGRYILQAVAHHIFADGRAYTRVKTIRSTIQQDDDTSTRS
jgi:hypothetical protein